MAEELDLQQHFSAEYKVPEPVAAGAAARDIDRLGMIGAAALKNKGYFTRIVVEDRAPAKRFLNPQSVRVLIVEDDEGTAILIEKALHGFGCKTLRAGNRLEIAAALGAKPLPHMVLLDVMLPDISGFDVLNRIRQHSTLANLPVMLLTSLGESKNIAKGLGLGASGYITKPVLPSTLLEAIETILGS